MSDSYTSKILYHLVGRRHPLDDDKNLATLRDILASMEIRTNKVAEYSGGKTLSIDPNRGCVDGEPISQTVSCFCDIPFDSLALHISKYGRFGVGVARSTVSEWGGRPVIYIPNVSRNWTVRNNTFCERVLTARRGLRTFFPDTRLKITHIAGADPESPIDAVDLAENELDEMLAFVKMFEVDLPRDDPKNYYMEREWRKFGNLPLDTSLREIIAPADFVEALRNEFPRLCELEFRPV